MRVGPITPSTPTSLPAVYGAATMLQSSEYLVARLLPDEELDAIGIQALVQESEDVALTIEGFEQAPQLVHVGQVLTLHQVHLAEEHVRRRL